MNFLVYDFEVFKHTWLVVFKEVGNKYTIFVNDYKGVAEYYSQHKNDVFVGYNNRRYDDIILKGILSNLDPKPINDWIIVDEKPGYKFPGLNNSIRLISLDLMQDIPGGIGISLKEIESNLGMSIEESDVPFDLDRPLTREEIEKTIKYCKHDVDATEKLLEVRSDYVKSKLMLINIFKLPLHVIGYTNAQLTADIMEPRVKKYKDGLEYEAPDTLRLEDKEILDFYTTPLDKTKSLTKDICGVKHKIAFGGLHGATEQAHYKDFIYNFDVASYYPTLILKYNFLCRGCKDLEKYRYIYTQRIAWKKEKDSRANAFKLVLNTFFGAMGHVYNKLYDMRQVNQICITGQLLLLDLLEKLEPFIVLIQSNTDGIMFQTKEIETCRAIIKEWETRTGMTMEEDVIKEVYQKDVNNYFIVNADGTIKSKGGYVKNFSIVKDKKTGELKEVYGNFVSNSITIVHEAIVKYLAFGIPVEDTVNNCNDPIRFQITTKKGPTYKRVEYEIDGQYYETNNVNRVFASKDPRHGKLFKIKQNGRKDTIASLPDHCLVYNKSVDTLDINLIDKQWYIKDAYSKIQDFVGGEQTI